MERGMSTANINYGVTIGEIKLTKRADIEDEKICLNIGPLEALLCNTEERMTVGTLTIKLVRIKVIARDGSCTGEETEERIRELQETEVINCERQF